jgi:hypothetical protein
MFFVRQYLLPKGEIMRNHSHQGYRVEATPVEFVGYNPHYEVVIYDTNNENTGEGASVRQYSWESLTDLLDRVLEDDFGAKRISDTFPNAGRLVAYITVPAFAAA